MEIKEIQQQCIKFNNKLIEGLEEEPDPRYLKMQKEIEDFTKNNLEKIANPKYELFSIVKQNLIEPDEYPIFFLKERQIFKKEGKLEWRYFGCLFDIKNNKVNYRTTTSYIPEKDIAEFN